MILSKEIESVQTEIEELWEKIGELHGQVWEREKGLPAVTEDDLIQLIKTSIKEQGITQTRISELTGCARATLSMALKGKRRMPMSVILQIMDIIGWKLVAVQKELPFTPEGEEYESSPDN